MIKYPRTFHLPWSGYKTSDDKVLKDVSHFYNKNIVVTEKMDGENCSLYHTGMSHARSIDSNNNISRNWIKKWWNERCYKLPINWRICGENLYAQHSITYNNLESYFYGFSIWNDNNISLSWEDTLLYFDELDITPVRELYKGIFDEQYLIEVSNTLHYEQQEGYVIRLLDEFHYMDFSKSVAKYVRKNHVTTNKHWMQQKIIPNKLKEIK